MDSLFSPPVFREAFEHGIILLSVIFLCVLYVRHFKFLFLFYCYLFFGIFLYDFKISEFPYLVWLKGGAIFCYFLLFWGSGFFIFFGRGLGLC